MPDWEEDGAPGHGVGTLAETAKPRRIAIGTNAPVDAVTAESVAS